VAFGGMQDTISCRSRSPPSSFPSIRRPARPTFSGNVLIGQGQMRLSADRVTVTYAAGRSPSRISVWMPRAMSPWSAARTRPRRAPAIYDVESGNVTLTGDVLLTQGRQCAGGRKW
jgi:lipopolysaccharide export system protein LptA